MLWWSKSLLVGLILLIFHSHFVSSSSIQPKCRPETRSALLNLTTNKSHFTLMDLSNHTADCCTWFGVRCDTKTGHVISLDLNLNGKMTSTSSLFSLIHLQSLSFYGLIHMEIGSDAFDALTRNLTKLQSIEFVSINMSSVPPASLMNFSSSLTYLEIRDCQLTGKFAQNSFHLPNLYLLDLSDNNLEGPIPQWIYALPNLEELYLDNNLFSGEIEEFQTTSLFGLSLNDNTLQGAIPRSLFQQLKLTGIVLSSNNLSGTIELEDLSNLKKLSYLNLKYNNLSVTNNCNNCTLENLSTIILSSCNLIEFPHFLRSSKYLGILDLSNNQIQGVVPKWLNDLKDLEVLDLHSNFFCGPLPIFSFPINFFYASKNQFSGEIPSSIFNITSFYDTVIDLSYNNLSGLIPPFIGNVENLLVLDLQRNNLRGQIPKSLFVKTSRLQSLNLNGNQLEGQVPRSLVHCSKLEVLDLGNNQFNDTFPDVLDSLPHLQVLVLRGNKFHGSIRNPNRFQQNPIFPFQELRIMDLSHNDFTGALPTKYFDYFKAMKNTSQVRLRYVGEDKFYTSQDYRGQYYQESVRVTMKGVDFEMERIQNIFTTIDLSSNKFTGEIPELLGNLKALKGLNLSHNMLTGGLPPSLGHLTNLEWLDLASNELVGKIPADLVDINGLQFFNVSYNHLEGPIPVGKQFNTFPSDSFEGNLNLCGFPLQRSCGGGATEPLEPGRDRDEDGKESIIGFGSTWSIVMMGYASGLAIGISMGYMLLSSKGKLHWLSRRILEEIEYRRAMRPKRKNGRRPQRK